MIRPVWLVALAALIACSSPEITERYLAEKAFFGIDRKFVNLKRSGQPIPADRYRSFANDYETVARAIPQRTQRSIKEIEGRAWLRTVECRFALVESLRAEIILTNTIERLRGVPRVLGEASLALGRVHESHGEYREAINLYRNVVSHIRPDPGPDPLNPPDPDEPPEEKTADDFVLGLPLHMARLAAREDAVGNPDPFYEEARAYYQQRLADPSPFVRIEAAFLLAEVMADVGEWRVASRIVADVEGRIPGIVMSRYEDADARLASLSYQIQALRFGKADHDSVRLAVDQLIRDYPHGDHAPTALFEMAQCERRLGHPDEAHRDLARIDRDYPTASIVPEAHLLRARLFARSGDWRDAQRVLRSLPLQFPTSDAALRAPLEIADYFRRVGDDPAERAALSQAERRYREIIERYPHGLHSYATREKLVTVYDLQGRRAEALNELLAMCDEVARPAQRPALLYAAARRAERQMSERARAASIFRRLADEFPDTRLGRTALRELDRLPDAQGQ